MPREGGADVLQLPRSLTRRLLLSHLLVAVLTSLSFMLMIIGWSFAPRRDADVTSVADEQRAILMSWLLGTPAPPIRAASGAFTLIVGADGLVRHARGETTCQAGALARDCAPALADAGAGSRRGVGPSGQLVEFVQPLADGGALLAHGLPRNPWEINLYMGPTTIRGILPATGVFTLLTTTLAAPPALLLSWLLAGPLARRLRAISRTSRRFAEGELAARIGDRAPDEVGDLARQFDEMAGSLTQTIAALRDLARENAELARQIEVSARQAERLRLSRDLHDEIAQQLFSLSLHAAALPDQIERDPTEGAAQARAVAAQAERALLDLRQVLIELRPAALAEHGIAEALESRCREWGQAHNIAVECVVALGEQPVSQSVEDVAYRVAQEALGNIVRHAGARHVSVALMVGRARLTLSITDDGGGFDPAASAPAGHLGLVGMRERARAVGGSLDVDSEPGRGTTLRLSVPLAQLEET
jgi:signal transduction histidine kinase